MRLRVILFLLVCLGNSLYAQEINIVDTTQPPQSLADLVAQRSMSLMVAEITIQGNKKTHDFIIQREMPFKKGDRIAPDELDKKLELARQQLMNTLLFVDVRVYVNARKGNLILVNVDLKERWYFFPLPYFRLVDRNFNQWWVDQKRSLERVNYGIKFIQNNTSGRNDNLDVWFINGYTQQLTLRYDLPFVDKKLRNGFNIGIIQATQKEVNFQTTDNKQQFLKRESITRWFNRVDFTYSYRPDVKQRHYFRFSYNKERVADTVLQVNPLYFPEGRNTLEYIDFAYQFKYYNVDYIPYPSKGFQVEANLYKRGINKASNLWTLSSRAVYAVPLAPKTFLHLEGIGLLKLPFNNIYFNQRLIGYGFNQLRGLEYNVVDGVAAGILKTTVHKQVFGFILRNPFPSKTHDRIPIRFFLKAYGDLGYGYNNAPQPGNTLNNKLLRTWGLGLDIVSIYDFVFKIEYSFNQLGRNGLYLQSRNDF
jgi:outer membrane protein assembly factor BamA